MSNAKAPSATLGADPMKSRASARGITRTRAQVVANASRRLQRGHLSSDLFHLSFKAAQVHGAARALRKIHRSPACQFLSQGLERQRIMRDLNAKLRQLHRRHTLRQRVLCAQVHAQLLLDSLQARIALLGKQLLPKGLAIDRAN